MLDGRSAPQPEWSKSELYSLYALRAGGDLVIAQKMVERDEKFSEAGGAL